MGVVLGTAAGIAAAVVATCICIRWGTRKWQERDSGGGSAGGDCRPWSVTPPAFDADSHQRKLAKLGKAAQQEGEAEATRQLYMRKLARSPAVRGSPAPLAWSCNPLAEGADWEADAPGGAAASDFLDLPALPAWRPLQQGSPGCLKSAH